MNTYIPPTDNDLKELIGKHSLECWHNLCDRINSLYDMECRWNIGGKKWLHEYKYRRGGKTLCALYAKKDCAGFMVILGKREREKFETLHKEFSSVTNKLYDEATTYHDGKWIMFPIDDPSLFDDYIKILAIKRKPNKTINS